MSNTFQPQFTHGPLPENMGQLLAGIPQAVQDEYTNNYNELQNGNLYSPYKPDSNDSSGYWSAAQTLSSWFIQQQPGLNGVGSTQNNPFSVPFTNDQKTALLSGLGRDPNPTEIFGSYNSQARWSAAVNNTYFNLGQAEASFSWNADGSLSMTDIYNFEGIGDFGAAPSAPLSDPISILTGLAKAIAVVAVVAVPATAAALVRGVLNSLGLNTGDPSLPYTAYTREQINAQMGNVANLYLKNTFTPQEIFNANPALFFEAVRRGIIPLDAVLAIDEIVSGVYPVMEVGTKQPSPILGFPSYAQNNMEINPNDSFSYGGNSGYPSPFTSFTQQLVNSNNYLGPYAKFGNVPGRLIIITSGQYIGQVGFVIQRWDNFEDGPYNIDSNGRQYPSKKDWFDTCLTAKVQVRFLHFTGRPLVNVSVAYKSFSSGNADEVFTTNIGMTTAVSGSLLLPQLIASLGAATLLII